ncbi:MAG: RibD family protein [Alphaproteobacteria bacterium]|nr:RibD family protein [Alphaproteobacteria bacterium]
MTAGAGLFDPRDPAVAAAWRALLAEARGGPPAIGEGVAAALIQLYHPLLAPRLVLGQLGQSLDGQIATAAGASHYVTGPESLVHLHRLRALVDAVVVGWRTVAADDPQLTVRHVEGPSPLRVVIDRAGRLPADRRIFAAAPPGSVRVTAPGTPPLPGVESLAAPFDADGRVDPKALCALLAARGCARVLIEGGGRLVSGFLQAGALDRLHVSVAPLIVGAGRPGLSLPGVADLADALRPPATHWAMGADALFDLDLAGERRGGGS